MKKIISMVAIFIMLISFNIPVYADDQDEEIINWGEVEQEIKEVSGNVEDIPKINSRAALIYDRTSGKVLYEKNRI